MTTTWPRSATRRADVCPVLPRNFLTALIKNSEHVRRLPNGPENWAAHIVLECDNAEIYARPCATVFLLSLLPNLQTSILESDWQQEMWDPTADAGPIEPTSYTWIMTECDHFVSNMMWLLIKAAKNPALRDQPLAKLKSVG